MTIKPDNDRWIKMVRPTMSPPSLKDNTGDVDRLIKSLQKALQAEHVSVNLTLAKKIPTSLRESNYDVCCVLCEISGSWQMVDLFHSQKDNHIFGLAMDLGTSTVVLRLLDLKTGDIKGESSFLNPQTEIGPDILTRIHFSQEPGGLERLQALLMERINQEILGLSKTYKIDRDSIVAMAAAGNTTMTHLFLGLDPYWICREPYIPVLNRPDFIQAAELGLEINGKSPILVLPNVGSYLGGDLIAGILASGMHDQEDLSILVDVGTNAEVVLGNNQWLMACAGAAGPALEGGVAKMGMMAGPGAIDTITIDPGSGKFEIKTIEDQAPIGICGSGLIDLVAQLFLSNRIDMRGKFVSKNCGKPLKEKDGIQHLIIVDSGDSGTGEALTLSQPEIDALLRSKAAMYTILTTIMNIISASLKDIHRFYIAGTFGSFIHPRSAITIGMIPDLPLETYVPIGNTSLIGAGLSLLSMSARNKAYEVRDRITYLELNVNQDFMNLFSAAKFIPHTDRSLFPSVKEW